MSQKRGDYFNSLTEYFPKHNQTNYLLEKANDAGKVYHYHGSDQSNANLFVCPYLCRNDFHDDANDGIYFHD